MFSVITSLGSLKAAGVASPSTTTSCDRRRSDRPAPTRVHLADTRRRNVLPAVRTGQELTRIVLDLVLLSSGIHCMVVKEQDLQKKEKNRINCWIKIHLDCIGEIFYFII